MKKNKILFFVFTILLQFQIVSSVVYYHIDMTCVGTKATGMGGAFIGIADDATAIIWNPAGLTQISKPQNSIITSQRNRKNEFLGKENVSSNFAIDFIGAAYPLKKYELVFAAAYQKPFNYNIDLEDDDELHKSTGSCNSFSIGIAKKILPYFSTGIAMNIWFGEVDFEYHYFEHDYDLYYDEWYDYEYIYDCDQIFNGINFILGGLIDLDTLDDPIPLKFGVIYRSAFKLEAKENGLLQEYLVWETGVNYYWQEELNDSRNNEIPTMIGLGASYNLNDNLKLAADFEIRAYSKSNINSHDEDLRQFRLGAEYQFETDLCIVPVRIGYFTYQTLLTDVNMKQVTGSGFSIGTGLKFNQFMFNFAYSRSASEIEHGSYGEQNMSDSQLVFSGTLNY